MFFLHVLRLKNYLVSGLPTDRNRPAAHPGKAYPNLLRLNYCIVP